MNWLLWFCKPKEKKVKNTLTAKQKSVKLQNELNRQFETTMLNLSKVDKEVNH